MEDSKDPLSVCAILFVRSLEQPTSAEEPGRFDTRRTTTIMEAPIATRYFHLKDKESKEQTVIFRMWRPYQPEGDYPRCAYELVSAQGTDHGEVPGVDAFDCIINCLSQAGTKIAGLNEALFGGQLEWEASPGAGRGLGLPTIEDHWPFSEAYRDCIKETH